MNFENFCSTDYEIIMSTFEIITYIDNDGARRFLNDHQSLNILHELNRIFTHRSDYNSEEFTSRKIRVLKDLIEIDLFKSEIDHITFEDISNLGEDNI